MCVCVGVGGCVGVCVSVCVCVRGDIHYLALSQLFQCRTSKVGEDMVFKVTSMTLLVERPTFISWRGQSQMSLCQGGPKQLKL